MLKKPLISIDISLGSYYNFIDEIMALAENDKNSEYICVSNVHMLVEAYRDKQFKDIVNSSIITTPDGLPLTWALKLLFGIKQERVAGMDLLPDLLQQASLQKMPVFFYGSTPDTLEKTKLYIKIHYPDIPHVGSISPPFRSLAEGEEQQFIEKINCSGAKLIFVSLGCPKQEKWMASMKGRVNGIMIGIGGALPVLIGEQKRAPHWMQKMGLEWFYRLLQEPRRLFRRYFFTNIIFISLVLIYLFRNLKVSK